VVLTLADMEGNESFDASCLGEAEEVLEKRVADDAMVSCTCMCAFAAGCVCMPVCLCWLEQQVAVRQSMRGTILLHFLHQSTYCGGQREL
jgi:hypothetical protein